MAEVRCYDAPSAPRISPRPAGTAGRTRITWWPAGGRTPCPRGRSLMRRAMAMTAGPTQVRARSAQAAIVAQLSPPLAGFEWRGTDDGDLRLKIRRHGAVAYTPG